MNKWIILIATLLVTLAFASTISVTITNPSGSNLVISGGLLLVIIIGFWLFIKGDRKKGTKVGSQEFVPIE